MSPSSTYDGIDLMLNCEDPDQRDDLTTKWRDHKLQELKFVGMVGALLAGCLTSTGNWPDVLQNGRHKPWSVRVLWFSGLVFALFAVMIAGLQSMRLHRLSSHRDGLAMIRAGLAGKSRGHSKNGGSGRRRSLRDRLPLRIQIYAWDASHAFLILSTLMMILGIVVLVWVSTEYGPGKPEGSGWWDDNAKMAVTFTAVLVAAILVLCVSQAALMGGSAEEENEGDDGGRIRLTD